MTKKDAEVFVEILEVFVIAVIRQQADDSDITDALNLINAKTELVKVIRERVQLIS